MKRGLYFSLLITLLLLLFCIFQPLAVYAAENTVPTISDIVDQAITKNGSTGEVVFTVGDLETAATDLLVTAVSDNQDLIPDAMIILGGEGENRTLSVSPVMDQTGSAIITVTVSDETLSTTDTFVVTVNEPVINTVPSFTMGDDQTVNEDTGPQTVPNWATDISPGTGDEDSQTLNFVISVDNRDLFSEQPSVSSAGLLSYTPADNANGTAEATIKLIDDGGTANGGEDTSDNQFFSITINPINDPPVNVELPGISGTTRVSETISATTGIWEDNLDGNLVDTLSYTYQWQRAANTAGDGLENIVGATESTYTLVEDDRHKYLCVEVTCSDQGTPGSESTVISSDWREVTNRAPVITEGDTESVTIDEDGNPTGFALSLNATDEDSDTLTWSIGTQAAHGVATVSGTPTGDSQEISYIPDVNYNGSDSFTVALSDGRGGSAGTTVNVIINPINDPPVNVELPVINGTMCVSETISATTGIWEDNLDGNFSDTLSYTYQWQRAANTAGDGLENIVGANESTYTIIQEEKYKYLRVEVTCSDQGTPGSESTVISSEWREVTNRAPVITEGDTQSVTIDEDGNPTGFALTLRATDEDSDTLTWSIETQAGHGVATVSGTPTGASQEISYIPDVNYNGSDNFSVVVDDGDGGSAVTTINVNINSINDVPAFTGGADQTVNEGAGTQSVPGWATGISKGPANESAQELTFTVSNDNNDLFSIQPAVSPTGTLTYTPVENAYGMATVTVVLKDDGGTANGGVDASASQTFTITVNAVNDAPSFTNGGNQNVDEDCGLQTVGGWATGISTGAANESAQELTFQLTITNDELFTAGGLPTVDPTTGTLTYTPADNANGMATVTVVLKDDGDTDNGGVDASASQTFTITVNVVNDPPVNTGLPQISGSMYAGEIISTTSGIWEDTLDSNLPATLNYGYQWQRADNATGDGLESIAGANGSTYTLVLEDRHKYLRVEVTCNDQGTPGSQSTTAFSGWHEVTNRAPSITEGDTRSVTMDEDGSPSGFALTLNATDEISDTLTWSIGAQAEHGTGAVSGTPTGASQEISYTPDANYNGRDSFSVMVSDEDGVSATIAINVNINSINDVPAFTGGADQTINEDCGLQTVIGWATGISAGAANESAQELTFQLTTTNDELFTAGGLPTVDLTTGNLTYTPADNAHGTATVTVILKDDGGTANGGVDASASQTFTITVNAVNDVPSFTKGENQNVDEDCGLQTVIGWATGISAGAANESAQELTFQLTTTNDELFTVGGLPTADLTTGNLTYTPADNAHGTATVTVILKDDGGTANGGIDASASQTFTIMVNAVNDVPTITEIADFSIDEDIATTKVFNVGDVEDAADTLNITTATDNTALIPKANVVLGGSGTDRTITVTPVADQVGEANITIVVSDSGGLTTNHSFRVTVDPVNDEPTIEEIADRTIDEDTVTGAIGFTVGDIDTDIAILTVTATSGNSELVKNENIVFAAGVSVNRTFTVRPEPDMYGSTTITVTVSDGSLTASTGFVLTVSPVNDPPTIVDIPDLTIAEDNGTGEILITINDIDNAAENLTMSASTNNTSMIPRANMVLSGTGANRSIVITPVADKNGSAIITLIAKDTAGLMATDTFTLTVNPVNDAPSFANKGNVTVSEDNGAYSKTWATEISSGPADESSQSLSFEVTNNNHDLFAIQPAVSATGVLTFNPAVNASGQATVTVVLSDNGGTDNGGVHQTDPLTFIIKVNEINDDPTLDSLNTLTINEDADQQIIALSGITPGGGAGEQEQPLTVIAVSDNTDVIPDPTVEYISPGQTGSIRFTPNADANGEVNITVMVSDGQESNNTVSRTFLVTVTAINDAPRAQDMELEINTDEDQNITGALLANDIENDDLTYSLVSNGTLGVVTITDTSKGVFAYTPTQNNFGTDTFTFKVNDGQYDSNVATVTVKITGVNDPPTATGQALSTSEDTPLTGSLIGADIDSITLTYTIEENPAHGAINNLNGSTGDFTYTPNPNFNGTDRVVFRVFDGFLYSNTATVTITVSPVNDAPTVVDEEVNLDENQVLQGFLKANDIEKDSLTYSIVEYPIIGTLVLEDASRGSYTYTPPANTSGDVTFTYKANDGNTDSQTKTVTIHIRSINQLPRILPPITFNTEEGTTLVSNVSASDPDGDSVTYSIVTTTTRGTLTLDDDSNGAFTYIPPNSNYNGVEYFTFKVTDGKLYSDIVRASITVTPVNDPPEAYNQYIDMDINTSNNGNLVAYDVDGGALTYSLVEGPSDGVATVNADGTYSYTPEEDFTGVDTFSFKATDSGELESNVAVMTIRVTGEGGTGIGISGLQHLTIDEDTTASLDLTMNGFIPTTLTAASSNTRILANSGITTSGSGASWNLSLTPILHRTGRTVITVTASNTDSGGSDSVSKTFILTVLRVNHTPTANAKSLEMDQETELKEFVTGHDDNGDSLTFAKSSDALHGTLSLAANGTFTYEPEENYWGEDSFSFTVNDNEDAVSASATVTISIRRVEKPPEVTEGTMTINEDEPESSTLLGSIPGGGSITFEIVSNGSLGTAEITDATTGAFTYTPNENANGTDTFTFKAKSSDDLYSNIAVMEVIITPINDAPEVNAKTYHTDEEQEFTGFLTAADVEGNQITFAKDADPVKGSVTVSANGEFTYVPNLNENGNDTFKVKAFDGTDYSVSTTITMIIDPVNDAPVANDSSIETDEDATKSGSLTAFIEDVDSDDTHTYKLIQNGSKGNVTLNEATGEYQYVPNGHINGTDYFSFRVNDAGGLYSNIALMTVTITPVNDPPTISDLVARDIDEDSSLNQFDFTIGDIEDLAADLAVTAVSDNPSLINDSGITTGGSAAERWIKITPIEHQVGSAVITITVADTGKDNTFEGPPLTVSRTLAVNVQPVDDTPTINGKDINNQSITDTVTIDEDTSTVPIAFTVDDEESGGDLTLSATSNNTNLVASPDGLVFGGSGNERTITVTPLADHYGNARITIRASDGNSTRMAYLDVVVLPVNDAPVITPPADQTINEDTGTGILYFNISDIDTDVENITMSAVSLNHNKVLDTGITLGGNGAERTVRITPVADANGDVEIRLTADDQGAVNRTGSATFTVHINPVNDAPTIEDIADQSIDEDTQSNEIAILLGDIDSNVDELTLSAISSNAALVPVGDIIFGGTGANRWVKIIPEEDQNGGSLITVRVSDGGKNTATSFNLTVNPVNDPPTISTIADQNILEDETTNTITYSVGDIDNDVTDLTVTAESGDQSVIPNGNIFLTGNGVERTVKVTPLANQTGSIPVSLTVSDPDGLTGITTFGVNNTSVNDAPSFTKGADQNVDEDAGEQTVANWAAAINKGAANESAQVLTFVTTNDNNGLFSEQPQVSTDGTLTYIPENDANGSATVTVVLKDDGGTANGGVDSSGSQTFSITVNAVNDAPSFTKGEDKNVGENTGARSYENWATDLSRGPADEDNQLLTFNVTNDNNSLFSLQSAISSTGMLTFTPGTNAHGEAVVTVSLHDNGGSANGGQDTSAEQTFHITVLSRNQLELNGTVKDARTEGLIGGATVRLYDLSGQVLRTATTIGDGTYSFNNLIENHYIVEVKHPSYSDNLRMTDVSFANDPAGVITENFLMADFTLNLEANPTSILGNGTDQSALTATVKDRNGQPISGVLLSFTTEAGSFIPGTTAVTASDGKAVVSYRSVNLAGIVGHDPKEELIIPVIVTIDDPVRRLYGSSCIFVTFAPGLIEGVVTDGHHNNQPVAGAEVRVYKDFNNDGITDFSFTQITGVDGKYKIAIPRGDMEYEIAITKPVLVGDTLQNVTFNQKARVEEILGAGDDSFTSNRTATGIVLDKRTDGSIQLVHDYSNMMLEVQDSSGTPVPGNLDASINEETGTFSAENLVMGNEYKFVIKYVVGDKKIIAGEASVKVTENGEVNINQILIDPYGIITDSVTGNVIDDVYVELFYADTARNIAGGLTPGTRVALPLLAAFPPADNANPQFSDVNGNYAFMVFPNTDYYIVATKTGYNKYVSPIIGVDLAIVRHDFTMIKQSSSSGVPVVPLPGDSNDLAISLQAEKMKVLEQTSARFWVNFQNRFDSAVRDVTIKVTIPEGMKAVQYGDGVVSEGNIYWKFDCLSPGIMQKLEFILEAGGIAQAQSYKEITAEIGSSEKPTNLSDGFSKIRILVYSNRYLNTHMRYMVGYPDKEFKPQRNVTRAETAAIFSRLLGLKPRELGQQLEYEDVSTTHWAVNSIQAMSEAGLMKGPGNGLFEPDKAITRAELCALAAKYLGISRSNKVIPLITNFQDLEGNWARSTIEETYRYKLVNGYEDGTFRPDNPLTRAEAASIINNTLYRGPLRSKKNTFPDVTSEFWAFGHIEEAATTHTYLVNEDGSEGYI